MAMDDKKMNNLDFFSSFLKERFPGQQVRYNAVANKIGISPQTLSAVLRRDDAQVSTMIRYFAAFGYSLLLHCHKDLPPLARPVPISSQAGPLAEVVHILLSLGATVHSVAQTVGVDHSVIDRMFHKGDVRISVLNRIANTYNISLEWTWYPLSFTLCV